MKYKKVYWWSEFLKTTGGVFNHKEIDRIPVELEETSSADGVYVFNSIHKIILDFPKENTIAMFETAQEFH